jgi:hypothetical protein
MRHVRGKNGSDTNTDVTHTYRIRHRRKPTTSYTMSMSHRTYDGQEPFKNYDVVHFDYIVYDIVGHDIRCRIRHLYDIVYDIIGASGKNRSKAYDIIRQNLRYRMFYRYHI